MGNRVIKFRAWHKVENKMYWVDRIDWTRDATAIFYLGVQLPRTMRESASQEYDLMQFTGLVDKSGKEIYEGDIVLWYGQRCKIVFKGIAFGIQGLERFKNKYVEYSFDTITSDEFECKDLEVIGNIWENEELLK